MLEFDFEDLSLETRLECVEEVVARVSKKYRYEIADHIVDAFEIAMAAKYCELAGITDEERIAYFGTVEDVLQKVDEDAGQVVARKADGRCGR